MKFGNNNTVISILVEVFKALERYQQHFLKPDLPVKSGKMRVAFVHPDLGLGGAERFIVDAALSLKDLGHDPAIFSPFQDASRCFEEVHPENPLVKVHVVPSVVPRSIFGRFQVSTVASRALIIETLRASDRDLFTVRLKTRQFWQRFDALFWHSMFVSSTNLT